LIISFSDSQGSTKLIPNPNPGDVSNLIIITNNIIIDKVIYNSEFSYECIITPNELKFYYNIRNIKLTINLQANDNSQINKMTLLKSINKKLIDNNVTVFIDTQTDKLGLNLGEMYCRLISDRFFPNGYSQKYIRNVLFVKYQKILQLKIHFIVLSQILRKY